MYITCDDGKTTDPTNPCPNFCLISPASGEGVDLFGRWSDTKAQISSRRLCDRPGRSGSMIGWRARPFSAGKPLGEGRWENWPLAIWTSRSAAILAAGHQRADVLSSMPDVVTFPLEMRSIRPVPETEANVLALNFRCSRRREASRIRRQPAIRRRWLAFGATGGNVADVHQLSVFPRTI